jgi:hypothetical protein
VPPARARRLWRLTPVLALVVLVALALGGAIDPLQSGALTMVPAVAFAAMMLTRPYLGERVIARLRARHRPRALVVERLSGCPRPGVEMARGGRLIASALAGRAPPPALAGCR